MAFGASKEKPTTVMDFICRVALMAVFRDDDSFTWFGWLCLLGAGSLAAAVIATLQGCVNAYTRFPTTDARIEECYQSTGIAGGMSIVAAFPQIMSDSPDRPSFMLANLVTIPIGCVGLCDTACEAVVDTVLLPADWALSRTRRGDEVTKGVR